MKSLKNIQSIFKFIHNKYEALFFGALANLLLFYCLANSLDSINQPSPFLWLFYLSLFLETLVILSLFLREDKTEVFSLNPEVYILIATIFFWLIASLVLNVYLASFFSLVFSLNLSSTDKRLSFLTIFIFCAILLSIKGLSV